MTSDPNFKELVDGWADLGKNLSCFLGAGASIGAINKDGNELPSAYDLRNMIWQRFKLGPATPDFDPSALKLMTLEHAGAIVEAKIGRALLSKYVTEIFSCDRPLWHHLALPYLAPRALFTTNYDELVELGYQSHLRRLDIICDSRTPVSGTTVLYKPHGSLTHSNQPIGKGGLVLTQFDYMEMIAEYREMLNKTMSNLNNSCVLIIGYSFGDLDIGAELFSMRKKNGDVPWYAIFPRDDPQVRRMYDQKFNIRQINSTFEGFVKALDDAIHFLPEDLKHDQIHTLRAQDRIQ